MKRIKVLILLACFTFIGWGYNWKSIEVTAKKIKTLQADFIQKKYLKILRTPLVSEGYFKFQAEKNLRWEYSSPIKSILLMNGNDIKRFMYDNNRFIPDQSLSITSLRIVMNEIAFWFSGKFNVNPDFTAKLYKRKKIVLLPKKKALRQMIKRIELHFSRKPGLIKKVVIYEDRYNYTQLSFKNVLINKQIPVSAFKKI